MTPDAQFPGNDTSKLGAPWNCAAKRETLCKGWTSLFFGWGAMRLSPTTSGGYLNERIFLALLNLNFPSTLNEGLRLVDKKLITPYSRESKRINSLFNYSLHSSFPQTKKFLPLVTLSIRNNDITNVSSFNWNKTNFCQLLFRSVDNENWQNYNIRRRIFLCVVCTYYEIYSWAYYSRERKRDYRQNTRPSKWQRYTETHSSLYICIYI